MFRQLVTPGNPGGNLTLAVMNNINSLFIYHPLQISALIETVWLNRNNSANSQTSYPFVPWSPQVAHPILKAHFFSGYDWTASPPTVLSLPTTFTFTEPLSQPGITHTWDGFSVRSSQMHHTNWDHLIYAYVIENTRIFEFSARCWKPICSANSSRRPVRRANSSGETSSS